MLEPLDRARGDPALRPYCGRGARGCALGARGARAADVARSGGGCELPARARYATDRVRIPAGAPVAPARRRTRRVAGSVPARQRGRAQRHRPARQPHASLQRALRRLARACVRGRDRRLPHGLSGGRFRFCGRYRVQSRLEEGPALLEGRWANGAAGLGADDVNAALRGAALWAGTAEVDLRAAEVSRRVGVFAEAADALYYRELFRPAGGSEPMRTDVLDVPKLREHWRRRRPDAARVLGAAALARLEELVGDVGRTGTNEYLCHEAGHA